MNPRLLRQFYILIFTFRCEGVIIATTMVANDVSYTGKKIVVDASTVQECASLCLKEENCGAIVYDTTVTDRRCLLFVDVHGRTALLPGRLVYRRSFLKNGNQILKLPRPAKDYYADHVATCDALGLIIMPAPTNVLDRTIIGSLGKVVMDVMTPKNSLDIVNAAGDNITNPYLRFYNFPTSAGPRYCLPNNYMHMYPIRCDTEEVQAQNTVCVIA